jgi:hypothetical protein
MTRPTISAAEALRLAREALEDDRRAALPGKHGSDDREPALARFVEAVLSARFGGSPMGDVFQRAIERRVKKEIGDDKESIDYARALAAALLRAADAADAGK